MNGLRIDRIPYGVGAAFAADALKYDEAGRPWLDPSAESISTGEPYPLGARFLVISRDLSCGAYRVRVSFPAKGLDSQPPNGRLPTLANDQSWLEVVEVLEPYQRSE
jgi:hypothetical protein